MQLTFITRGLHSHTSDRPQLTKNAVPSVFSIPERIVSKKAK